jgi:hypothetical protein
MEFYSLPFIGFTLDIIGKVMVAYTALKVHHRVRKEHKIDDFVFKEMHKEGILGVLGIILMIMGYFLQVPTKLGL